MSYELNKKIRELEPYEPISGTYKIRLDANECPENYPDFIKEEIKNAILYLIENDTIREMIANNALDIKKTNAADIIYKKYYDYFESCYNK